MPKASKETASKVEEMGVMEGRYEELGGYTVGFEMFREDADAAPLMKGLPDDRCQSPHWGYVVSGRVTFSYPDREEVCEAGNAYIDGTEVIEFSPTENYERTLEVIGKNMAAMQNA